MKMSSGLDDAPLSVLLDVRHPQSYLALGPTAELGRALDIEINWLPTVVPPLNPPSLPCDEDDRGVRHRRSRAQAIAREIETYAAAQGLVIRDYYREPDPTALNLAWLWLRSSRPDRLGPFLSEVFRAYWAAQLDPSDSIGVARRLDAQRLDGAACLAWCRDEGPRAGAALAGELRERGLTGATCYVVGDEVFLGRQHLPMIRWLLDGREEPGPI